MKLIKFLTLSNYFWDNLKNNELFFNNLSAFNDPFEGIFRFKLWDDPIKLKKFYLEDYCGDPKKLEHFIRYPKELENKINRVFNNRFKSNGVTCFSSYINLDNILMWSHYASKHSGICIVFDTDSINFKIGNLLFNEHIDKGFVISLPTGPFEVLYTDDYLNEDPLLGNLNQQTFLTTKFSNWKYEKEFRYISPVAGLFNYNPQSIKEVIFGLRTPINSKKGIKNILDDLGVNPFYKSISMEKEKFSFGTIDENF